ncbi:MAG: (d)CMP kinase [Cyanobacteria bacterium]|nr:(d)CMP kinase [Cyanobacteriota bacterium]MDA1019920.1 (d)CMP kinase [Cyanobacteriota bacterium]
MTLVAIAIDGPAGSGKSTIAKRLATELAYIYIDSGAMYRAVTYKWLEKSNGKQSDQDPKLLSDIINQTNFVFDGNQVLINDQDCSKEIRSNNVSQNVSYIASFPVVREKLVELQRQMAKTKDVVMDGRDIGTVVFPDAKLKVFMVASAEVRAQRRAAQLKEQGEEVDLEQLIQEIKLRDKTDSQRTHSPLVKADDAIEIKTDNLSIEEVVEAVLNLI